MRRKNIPKVLNRGEDRGITVSRQVCHNRVRIGGRGWEKAVFGVLDLAKDFVIDKLKAQLASR